MRGGKVNVRVRECSGERRISGQKIKRKLDSSWEAEKIPYPCLVKDHATIIRFFSEQLVQSDSSFRRKDQLIMRALAILFLATLAAEIRAASRTVIKVLSVL